MRDSVATNVLDLFFIVTSELLNRITDGKFKLCVKSVQIPSRTSTTSVATTEGDKKRTTHVRYLMVSDVMSDGPEPVNGAQATTKNVRNLAMSDGLEPVDDAHDT